LPTEPVFKEKSQTSIARLFCKNKQENMKNKPKIANLTKKQAQYALAENSTKRKMNK